MIHIFWLGFQVTRELGQVVGQFLDSEGAPIAAPTADVDVASLTERLRALRQAVTDAAVEEKALLDQCQQVSPGATKVVITELVLGDLGAVTDHCLSVVWHGVTKCRSCSCCQQSKSMLRVTSSDRWTMVASANSSAW